MSLMKLFLILLFTVIRGADALTDLQYEGYDETPAEDVAELTKALQAQEGITDIADLKGGGALQVQSLETQLAMLTFQEKHLKFSKDIGVQKAFSTLEEYSIQDGYGTEGGFVGQMENPEEGDPDFRRAFAVVKYIRTLWKTADVLSFTKQITNAEVLAVQSAMMRSLRTTEKSLFFADSAMIPQSFNGIIKTVETEGTTDHIRDLRGENLTEANMRDGSEIITQNYGVPTKMYTSLGVQTIIDQIVSTTKQNVRLNIEQLKGDGVFALGGGVNQFRSSFGNFLFEPDIFIGKEAWQVPKIKDPSNPKSLIEGATSAKAPATPSIAVTINAPTVSGSLWSATAGDSGGRIAGDYRYRVCAINQYGKSAACVASAAKTVAAAGSLTVAITSGGGSYAPTAYEVYGETIPTSGVYRYMKTVAASVASYVDKNLDLPGTAISVLVDNTTVGEMRTMSLSQLAPMHKVQYAKIAPYKWGTVNYYIVPKWYAPLRYVIYKNIGVQRNTQNQLIDM